MISQAVKGKVEMSEVDKVSEELASFKEEKPLKLYVDDITTEKLTSVLADNDGRAAILSTEGGIFDTLAGIYTKNVNIDVILKGYSGDSIRVDRIGRQSESVMTPALTMLLMAQPSVLSGLIKAGMNPKTLQYLMGHSDISVTMNVYTHINFDDAEEELRKLEEFRKAQAEIEKKNEKPMSQKMFKAI